MDIRTALLASIEQAVENGQTHYSLAKQAGLKPELLYRFVKGERDLRLSSFEKLCELLNLELRPIKRSKGKNSQ